MKVLYVKLVFLKTELCYEKSVMFKSLTKIPFCNHIIYFYTPFTLENREQFLIPLLICTCSSKEC